MTSLPVRRRGLTGLLAIAVVLVLAACQDLLGRLLLLTGVALVGVVLIVTGWTVPGRRLVPYWGRIADILHVLLAVALIPLMLQVIGVFAAIRAIAG